VFTELNCENLPILSVWLLSHHRKCYKLSEPFLDGPVYMSELLTERVVLKTALTYVRCCSEERGALPLVDGSACGLTELP
jgi:hypothetical protein